MTCPQCEKSNQLRVELWKEIFEQCKEQIELREAVQEAIEELAKTNASPDVELHLRLVLKGKQ
jgi:hypothetical protein